MMMGLKYDVIKNQKFDIGRTINPFKCDCERCDFLRCPKKNYVPKTKPHRYTVKEYIEFHADELKKDKFPCGGQGDDLTEDFILLFNFPKGTYWRLDYDNRYFELITFSRRGQEVLKGVINRWTGKITDYDMSAAQEKLAHRISTAIKQINDFMSKEAHNGI